MNEPKMDNLDYGIIGNGRSCALISRTGSIDWCCLADFDSPSVFGALLDPVMGGRFAIQPEGGDWTTRQAYLPHTNVLCTRFASEAGEFQILDFMPCYRLDGGNHHCPPDIVRLLIPTRGAPQITIQFEPRLRYAEIPTRVVRHKRYLKAETTQQPHESVYLYGDVAFDAILSGKAFRLEHAHFLLLSYDQKIGDFDMNRADFELQLTKAYWMAWSARTTESRTYPEPVERSALVLKLLSYRPTGAILAAATTSLPETIGEERNWDYRFCWIRDASMMMRTLVNLRHHDVAQRFFGFLLDVVPYKNEHIQIMYGIRGQKTLTERTLDWLSGYHGSRPVRIGNAAWDQQQNDIYGVLLDALYYGFVLFRNQGDKLEALWTMTRGIVRHIEAHWREPDQGIWEFRGEPQHFTYSKVMCWVGMDRAIRIASLLGMDEFASRYVPLRDQIRDEVLSRAWNPELQTFTQAYGSKDLDASLLLLQRLEFIDANDPRWIATVKAIHQDLCKEGLMYRYRRSDDFGTPTSSFTSCSFWMIQALLSIGEEQVARRMLDQLLGYANHLGLYSEDLDFATHRLLGNFPQGYSHLALIDTVMTLERLSQRADAPQGPSEPNQRRGSPDE